MRPKSYHCSIASEVLFRDDFLWLVKDFGAPDRYEIQQCFPGRNPFFGQVTDQIPIAADICGDKAFVRTNLLVYPRESARGFYAVCNHAINGESCWQRI